MIRFLFGLVLALFILTADADAAVIRSVTRVGPFGGVRTRTVARGRFGVSGRRFARPVRVIGFNQFGRPIFGR